MKTVNSQQKTDNNIFISPTHGPLKLGQVIENLVNFHDETLDFAYRIIIGTDSQQIKGQGTNFVTAVICHRVGQGAIYFWRKKNGITMYNLKQRILSEAIYSLELAEDITEKLTAKGLLENNLEIHVDIGRVGPTREMISEVIGMVRASGYAVKIKPEAFGASKVADRHV